MAKWIKTNFPGVRYREHPTRKHGVKKDQYFTIRYKLNGRDKEEGLGWSSEGWTAAKAYDRLKELKENKKTGEGPQTLKEKRDIAEARKIAEQAAQARTRKDLITFGRFFMETYLPHAKTDKKPRSIQREEGLVKHWIGPLLGNLPLKDIVPVHLEKLKKEMTDKGQSPRSIEYALALVRQVFNTARRLGIYAGESPTAKVKKPKVDNSRMRFLKPQEAEDLLNLLKTKSVDTHDMTLLALHCGLRFGEIAALTWQDVDLEKGTLIIRDAKAGSRYAFLTEQATVMLKDRIQGKPADYVFQKKGGGKVDRISHTFFRSVDELKLNDGIDDPRLMICFHSCRHSYASWLIEQGEDLYTVQKLLGHKTNIMTQRYAHLAENKLRNAAVHLGQALDIQSKDSTESEIVEFTN